MKNAPNKIRLTWTAIGRLSLPWMAILFFALPAGAQTTSFTFQKTLPSEIIPATGTFQMEFRLFDALTDGTQIGPTVTIAEVAVKNRAFSVQLDFGPQPFSGADRFVEVSVRSWSDEPFTIVATRTQVLSVPYAIRALNAATADNALNLGGVNVSDFVQTTDARLSDSRNPNPGSNNYIQNTTMQQTPADFNISGNGMAGGALSANIINSTTQYNIGGNRVLSVGGTSNTFTGINAGGANTSGEANAFFGTSAGAANTTGNFNAIFGSFAGVLNTTGIRNALFGTNSGRANTTGNDNSFFGTNTGIFNTTGSRNAFFGSLAGTANTTGNDNSFFGVNSGFNNSTAFNNSFFGMNSGLNNTTGNNNSFFGRSAGSANTTGNFNAIFGSFAGVSNTTGIRNAFFGTNSGRTNTAGDDNSFFGTNTGFNTTGERNAFFGSLAGVGNTTGDNNSFFGFNAGVQNTAGVDNAFFGIFAGDSNVAGSGNSYFGNRARGASGIANATAIGSRAFVSQSNSLVLGGISGVNGGVDTNVGIGTSAPADRLDVDGIIRVSTLGAAGATSLCRNASNQLSTCSSSLRYKMNIAPFAYGMNLVKRLQPITFNWKEGGMPDLGLGAEDVARIEPLLATYNAAGEVEGVKYDRIGVVLLNAVKEQQAQIEAQQKQINKQTTLIKTLRVLVCQHNAQAQACKKK